MRYTIERVEGMWEVYDNRLGQVEWVDETKPKVPVITRPIAVCEEYEHAQLIADALNAS